MNNHFIYLIALIASAICMFFCQLVWADEYVIQSEHFYVVSDEEYSEYVQKMTAYSEKIYPYISKCLRSEIDTPIFIIFQKKSDAKRIDWIPEETIFVYSDDALSDESIQRQIARGMALTLTLNTSDFSKEFKTLLYRIATNNKYAPLWYLLGLADFYATPNEPGALTKSPEYRAKLTAILKAYPSLSLGDLAAGIQGGPNTELNEIIGLGIIQFVAQNWGVESLTEWNHLHSRSVIPYVYQKQAKALFGIDWNDIFEQWRNKELLNIQQNNIVQASEFIYYRAKIPYNEFKNHEMGGRATLMHSEDEYSRTSDQNDTHKPLEMYSAIDSMWPDEISPLLGYDDNTGFVIGLSFFGEDVLNHHIYQSYVQYMTEKNHVDLLFNYEWKPYAWALSAEVALLQQTVSWERDDKLHSLDYMTHYADLGTKRSWQWNDDFLDLKLAYRFEYNSALHEYDWKQHNQDESPIWLPQLGWTSSVYMGITYRHSNDTARTMLDKAGYLVHVDAHIETPFLGGSDYTFINHLRLSGAWVMPYLDRHAIAVDLHAGYSNSENSARFPFIIQSDHKFSFNNDVSLHGYPTGSTYGRIFALLNLKYSANIWDFQSGFDNFPLGINRIGFAIYGDSAVSLSPDIQYWPLQKSQLVQKYATGLEIYFDLMFAWNKPVRLIGGFAHALTNDGDTQYYIMINI